MHVSISFNFFLDFAQVLKLKKNNWFMKCHHFQPMTILSPHTMISP